MQKEISSDFPIIFLGLAEHIEKDKLPFPIGSVDLMRLSHHKWHIVFPISIKDYNWIFLIEENLITSSVIDKYKIEVVSEDGKEKLNAQFHFSKKMESSKWDKLQEIESEELENHKTKPPLLVLPRGFKWHIVNFQFDQIISKPQKYKITVLFEEQELTIGEVAFIYKKVEPFSIEQIKAIEADPNAPKMVVIKLACKKCPSEMLAYSAMERNPQIENEGKIWQNDLPRTFNCECGRTTIPLEYLKESLHGILEKDFKTTSSHIHYLRRYAHSEILKIIQKFKGLLNKEKDEKPFQEFIEKNPILLARFQAKKLFIKPSILGKFEADFAILDSRNQLILIELEKPSMRLFKKDGHPRAALMHAYGQVQDWINEYNKHPTAVIEGLKLKTEEVMGVRGVVIAGRIKNENVEHLRRHLASPPYGHIYFLTLDDLPDSLLLLSRELS